MRKVFLPLLSARSPCSVCCILVSSESNVSTVQRSCLLPWPRSYPQEKALREQGKLVGKLGPSAFHVDGIGRVSDPYARKVAGNSSTLDVAEELEEQPLIRHRSTLAHSK